ncbi:uncharacterized protein PHACADRAFT_261224 [Phanerochaete carnosa HHB-10118-sp]|uniref:Uncharacterized protein n=1 Tax=Phanerochaete carnosa (strain HHB-10118-sp) TaxID=650164 RepID=K5WQL4_PHACS|nr:uncharacterized protein PHACADRAFT_261224 [Phanerochaete carnosa HHB-10118-sp]EKM52652.1 hypothetical protein PHACADRAFT_261224 [Phanerochaete carnosa HHB-10118-sp]
MNGVPEPVPAPTDWEVALQQLRITNEELQRRRLDAEKDRELFRELYNKASAHASEVAKENSELLERAQLAEGRLRDGLAMVRGTYEERVRALQGEVEQLTGLNAILVAKDIKTNGDEIRRRAAEEENLRVDNQKLRAEIAELRLDYRRMERLLEQLGEKELEQLTEQEEEIKQKLETPVASGMASTDMETFVKTETIVTR